MLHVRPYPISSAKIIDNFGYVLCDYCRSESTDDTDATWIVCPISHSPPKFICLGCCEDIYSACAADNFAEHPFFQVVEDAAAKEELSVNEFRQQCLRQQLNAASERQSREQSDKYSRRAQRLKAIIQKLEVTEE